MKIPVRATMLAGALTFIIAVCQPRLLPAQPGAMAAQSFAAGVLSRENPFKVTPVADMPSRYVRPGPDQPVRPGLVEQDPKKGRFEFFDVDNLAGMAGGAIAAGIADQRRREYYRQDFFYGGRPYYGPPYYGGPAYYGGPYSTYYYRK